MRIKILIIIVRQMHIIDKRAYTGILFSNKQTNYFNNSKSLFYLRFNRKDPNVKYRMHNLMISRYNAN